MPEAQRAVSRPATFIPADLIGDGLHSNLEHLVKPSDIIEIPDHGGPVAILADLHFRSHFWHGGNPLGFHGLEDRIPWSDLDALIIAGDLSEAQNHSWRDALTYLAHYVPAERTYILPGNHDYFMGRLDDEASLRDLAAAAGVTLVQKTELRHRGDRYLCMTLWTDFSLLGDPMSAMNAAQRAMRDYDMILKAAPNSDALDPDEIQPRRPTPIAPADTLAMHQEHRRWLEERLSSPHFAGQRRTIVVSHHGPHPSAAGVMEQLAPAFHSDLTPVLEAHDIDFWYFGHSHRRLSAVVAGTTLRNVSIGYPDEKHDQDENDLAAVCLVSSTPP